MPPKRTRPPAVVLAIDSDGDVSASYSDFYDDEPTLDELDALAHFDAPRTPMIPTYGNSGGPTTPKSDDDTKPHTQTRYKTPVKKRPRVVYDSEDEVEESTDNILAPLYAMRTPKASPVKPTTKDKGKAPARLGASRASSASTSGYSNVTTPSISDSDVKPRFKTPIKKRPRVVYDSDDEEDGQNGTTQSILAPLHGLLSPKASPVKLTAKDKGKAPASTWTPFPLKASPRTPRLSAAPLKLSQESNVPLISAISIPTPAPSPTKPSRAKIRALVAAERSLDYMDVDAPITKAPLLGPAAAEPFYIQYQSYALAPAIRWAPERRTGIVGCLASLRPREPPLYDLTTEDSCVVQAQPPIDILQDVRKLAWATQWELSRLVTEGKLEWNSPTLRKKLASGELDGGAVDVARSVAEIVLASTARAPASVREYEARAPWAELDREASALDVAVYGCMGTMNDAIDDVSEGWYGGNIHHAAKLVPGADGNGEPTIALLRPERHSSSLFARRFGSDSYLRLRIAPELLGDPDKFECIARGFLLRPFVICGRTYEVRYTNRDSVTFLLATNTTTPRGLPGCEARRFMSFHHFFQWFNPLELNSEQSVAKYCARIALGFSNSVPGGMLKPEHIHTAEDIVSEDGELMSDGCGFTTLFTLEAIQKRLGWSSMPTAVQLRTFGSKGIVHLHPDAEAHRSKHLAVYLRPSQVKIERARVPNLDPAHLEVSILRPGRMSASVKISQDIVVCLAENGVPTAVFESRLKQQLADVVSRLLDWPCKSDNGQPSDMLRLWAEVERTGNVVVARHARTSHGSARARGLVMLEPDEIDDEDTREGGSESRDISFERSLAWWPDDVSGMPSTLEETILVMLQAGFRPDENAVLAHKLKQFLISLLKAMSRALKVRLLVSMSASAWIVPDPFGVLEEGEIFFKSSKHNFLLPDGRYSDTFVGWVLVVRDPCKLPSDVQKVRAVFKAELRDYHDQIVFSTKGKQSLASLLAGGDYDGDRAVVIWDPEMVEPFRNASPTYATPPKKLDDCFDKYPLKASEFAVAYPTLDEVRMRAMQNVIVTPLKDVYAPGLYSNMHANSAYVNGYDHPLTISAAWKFCLTLDGAKSGMTIKDTSFATDKKDYASYRTPEWKHCFDPDASKFPPLTRRRDLKLPPFVLDTLSSVTAAEEKAQLDIVNKKFESLAPSFELDPILCVPARQELDACKAAMKRGDPRPLQDFEELEKHVHGARQALYAQKRDAQTQHGVQTFTGLPIRVRQDILRAGSRQFSSYPKLDHPRYEWMCRVRASIAYSSERFPDGQNPYEVAMRDLCRIKAESQGGGKPMTAEFADVMKIWKGALP